MSYPFHRAGGEAGNEMLLHEHDEGSTGRSWTADAANSTPHSTPSTAPIISDITNGAVFALVVVKMKAKRNSFQA